jgi:hypothetical protein
VGTRKWQGCTQRHPGRYSPCLNHVLSLASDAIGRGRFRDVFPDRALARWLVVVVFAAVALVLGYIGLHEYVSQEYLSPKVAPEYGRGWADILFYDVELFVLNSAPAGGPGPIPLPLGIARFLAPAMALAATVETVRLLLSEQLRRWAAAHASGHAIVTGDGPVAAELASKLGAEYRTVVLVSAAPAASTPGDGRSEAPALRGRRLLRVTGDPTDGNTLLAAGGRRAEVIYACTQLSTTNAATVLRAWDLRLGQRRPLMAFAQVRDAEICIALRARHMAAGENAGFRLDFFSIEDIAARVLLDNHPLVDCGVWPAQVVIIGFERLGRAVLREIARRSRPDGHRLEVSVRGPGADKLPEFHSLFPGVSRNCVVTSEQGGPERPYPEEPTVVFVCLRDNDDALNAGLTAAHSLTTRAGRVVICMPEPSPFGTVLTGQRSLLDDGRGRLTVFGVFEEGSVPGRIREDLLDQLARAIHQAYLDECTAQGDSPERNPSMRPWAELPDHLKQANLAQATDISHKLITVGCDIVPESGTARPFAFTETEVEKLAEQEHERWMAERTGQGYVFGSDRNAKQHPDLVAWADLTEHSREKDRNAVREIPSILQQAGFQVVRVSPGGPAG